jgi:hypothetical protein
MLFELILAANYMDIKVSSSATPQAAIVLPVSLELIFCYFLCFYSLCSTYPVPKWPL